MLLLSSSISFLAEGPRSLRNIALPIDNVTDDPVTVAVITSVCNQVPYSTPPSSDTEVPSTNLGSSAQAISTALTTADTSYSTVTASVPATVCTESSSSVASSSIPPVTGTVPRPLYLAARSPPRVPPPQLPAPLALPPLLPRLILLRPVHLRLFRLLFPQTQQTMSRPCRSLGSSCLVGSRLGLNGPSQPQLPLQLCPPCNDHGLIRMQQFIPHTICSQDSQRRCSPTGESATYVCTVFFSC